MLAVSGQELLAGTAAGIFRSSDNGKNWEEANTGLPPPEPWLIGSAQINCLTPYGKNLYVGTKYHGIFRTKDDGKNWKGVSSGLPEDVPSVNCLAVSGQNLFAGTDGGVFRFSDNGESWVAVDKGLPRYARVSYLAAHGQHLFAAVTWEIVIKDTVVEGVSVKNDPLNRYGLFSSSNSGKEWKALDSGLSEGHGVEAIAVLGDTILVINNEDTFLSTISGGHWTLINSDLPKDIEILCFMGSDGNLLIGSYSGVYLSADKGKSWRAINSGFPPDPTVQCLAMGSGHVFAGTKEGGVWKLPLSIAFGKR